MTKPRKKLLRNRQPGVASLLEAAALDPLLFTGNACADEDPEMFFDHRQEEEARAVCARCPVKLRCLEVANSHAAWGVWGGQSFGFGASVGPGQAEIEEAA